MITRSEVLAATGGALAFAAIFCWRIIANLDAMAVANDWDIWLNEAWVARQSILHFHQLPLWNPYWCGGVPLLADPQSHILAPFFPLALVFGPAVGLHLEIPLHLAIGWVGAYLLARIAGIGRLGAVGTACVFCSSSWFFLHMAAGHVVFLSITYTPLIVASAWLGAKRHRIGWSVAAAALIAISFGEGGVYAASYQMVAVALLMLPLAALDRSLWPMLTLAIVIVLAPCFAAVKLLPTLAFYDRYPRPIDSAYWASIHDLAEALFSHNQDLNHPGLNWGFWEYGAYIGVFALPAIVGLARPRRAMPWAFAALMLFILARGDTSTYAPWALLHRLPGFQSERIPWRMLMLFVLMVGVLAGIGIDLVIERMPRWGAIAGAALIAAGTIDGFIVSTPNLRYVLGSRIADARPQTPFRQYLPEFYADDMFIRTLRNEGSALCYFPLNVPINVTGYNQADYRGEQYFLGASSVRLSSWSPNKLNYEVFAQSADLLIINQNYDPAWRVVRGAGAVIAYNGLLAVYVPAGTQHLELKYVDRQLMLGASITLLAIALSIFIIGYECRKSRASRPRVV